MKISHLSELQAFLQSEGLTLKKHSSQNFLIDSNIVRKIVRESEVAAGDTVIEIGPGAGALTEGLLEGGAHVIAIEKDPQFADTLIRLQTEDHRLQVIKADILECPIEELLSTLKTKVKVVANLPYHITTPILEKFVPLHDKISTMTLMVQKEVGDRFVAKKNTKSYSSFTIFLEYYCDMQYLFTVEPSCFHPKPSVQSCVVQFCLKSPTVPVNESEFFPFVRAAFQQRRKMLRSSLRKLFTPAEVVSALQALSFEETARPEQLSLGDFINLYKKIRP